MPIPDDLWRDVPKTTLEFKARYAERMNTELLV
jgi:hypothetical protein